MRTLFGCLAALLLAAPHAGLKAQNLQPDWEKVSREAVDHFRALLRLDTSNPPGNETIAVDYLKKVLDAEGISSRTFALEPARANLVVRLKSTGAKRPLLLLGHTDVVTVDPTKWKFSPFGAVEDGGYIYGRGALDDKPHVATGVMIMVLLKRLNIQLDRDVIFLAESGEEGTTRVGIDFMVSEFLPEITAEYCLAEGGGVRREGGKLKFASVGVLEKIPRTVELTARGPSGHGSVPLRTNAVSRLALAVAAISQWQPEVKLNETTREYFKRLVDLSGPEDARRMRDILSDDPQRIAAAAEFFQDAQPSYAAMLRTSVSPTILRGGDRYNVIPSEAKATLDVRMLPDEDPSQLLAVMRTIVNDPSVTVEFAARDGAQRPPGGTKLNTEAFRIIEEVMTRRYGVVTLPTMSTGATDKAQMRSKGVDCYGIGPAGDAEDSGKGFGGHGDQKRILRSDFVDFLRAKWEIVLALAQKAP